MWSASSRTVTSTAPRSQWPWLDEVLEPAGAGDDDVDAAGAAPGPAGSGRRRRRSSSCVRPSARASGSTTAATWLASSRVGTRTRPRGRAGLAAAVGGGEPGDQREAKARVLPEPVRPRPSTSRPARLSGSVATWIGNGAVMPLRGEHLDERGGDAEGVEGGVGRQHGGVRRRSGRRRAPGEEPTGAGGGVARRARRPRRAATAAAATRRRPLAGWRRARGGAQVEVMKEVLERSGGRTAPRRARARRTCTGAGRAHIVSETSVSRAHLGGAASSPTSIPAAPDERGRRRYTLLNQTPAACALGARVTRHIG